MSDFKAKMHKIRFRLRHRIRPRWGAYSAPPDSVAVYKGAYFLGEGGRRGERGQGSDGKGERKGKRREDGGSEGRGRKGRGWASPPPKKKYFALEPPLSATEHAIGAEAR